MKSIAALIIFIGLLTSSVFAQECHIIFGASLTPYKPYSWVDDNNILRGMNIELFKALVKEAGCTYEMRTMPWTELLESFNNNEIDVIASSLPPFPKSHKGDNLLQIPFNIAFYGYFYIRQDSEYIKDLDDLNGKAAVVLQSSVTHDYMDNLGSNYNITVIPYPSTESAMEALSSGVGDVGIFSITAAINVLESGKYTNLKISGKPVFPASYGFLVHDNVHVYNLLNDAMDRLKSDGAYFDIVKKWHTIQNVWGLWFKRVLIIISIVILVTIGVMIWNKMLYEQVRKKTADLKQEIEQRKLTEQQNLKLRDEAMVAGKLAVLGEMATSIVHEINNPTGLIIHNIDFLTKLHHELRAKTASIDTLCGMNFSTAMAEADDALLTIDESLVSITDTINELKEYGKDHANVSQVIELKDCINASVKLTRYFFKRYTSHFSVDIKIENLKIYGNMLHIEQVIVNLIHNACYALTDKTQKITCSLDACNIDDIAYGKILVIDEGIGMNKDVIAQLFTPFFSTRKNCGGTGLGLTIISRIVKEHNGFIEVKSELGKGSEISVFLPLFNGDTV